MGILYNLPFNKHREKRENKTNFSGPYSDNYIVSRETNLRIINGQGSAGILPKLALPYFWVFIHRIFTSRPNHLDFAA